MVSSPPLLPLKTAAPGNWRIGIFRGLAGLDELEQDWQALFGRLDRPGYVHLWEWHRSYLGAGIFDPEKVIFCAVYEAGEAVAILPLVAEKKSLLGVPLRLLALPLDPLTLHADILVDPRVQASFDLPAVLRALHKDLGEPWDMVRLGLTPEDSVASSVVAERRSFAPRLLAVSHQRDITNALEIAPYDEVFARFSRNFRGSLRNCRNRLAKLDRVEVRCARGVDQLEEAFQQLLAVEASGWKGKAGTAIRSDPRREALYGGFIRHIGPTGRCRIDLLMRGEHVMAGLLSVAVGDRLYAFKIGYDESYKREAPGTMLLERVLQSLAEEPGIRYLDLISNQPWHREWRPVQRRVLMHYLCRASPRSLLAWSAMRGRKILRSIISAKNSPTSAPGQFSEN